ncbi:restriction modification system DNA specificity domain [Staphylothermus marinus F1]|uniref:Restriction modification system DNA specificity domain n=1 Tax=Staphylothermus marinus (strain ATCC 43588 / DSM 3639 / JCM 9404 / F1) TaxID=399550 RepID=A3DMK3_STAMF|nr:restriction endonuclease subunit S [Staphylothermus marinus]ABN69863.1 restriction modification system DNA specificity domain [Staphylothermus marinus F1]
MPHKTLDEYLKQQIKTTTKQETQKEIEYKIIGFYKETDFKETPIGKIPRDWNIMRLDGLVKVETGKRAKGGGLYKGNIASIGGEHIDDEGNIRWNNMKFITEDFYNSLRQGKINIGDILLVKDGATTGKVAIVRELKYKKVAVNEHVFVIRSITKKLINEFLFYFLYSKFGQMQIKTRFHGMIGGITRNDLKSILIPLPPVLEQRRIVEVLSIVDEAIQKTDDVIAKVERLKKALMQELLTGKVRIKVEDGKARFYKETNFKDTKIGKIPKDWEVIRLVDHVYVLKGYAFSSKFFNEKERGIPIIRIRDLGKNKTEAYYSGSYDPKYIVEKGDLLISMDGEFNIFLWKGPKGLLNQRVCKIWTKDATKLDNMYLYYALKKPLKLIEAQTSQTTVKHLLDRDLERIKIPLPPLSEQQKIAEILSTIDKWISLEHRRKEKLKGLKKGLMNLLLTGRIRVRVERVS